MECKQDFKIMGLSVYGAIFNLKKCQMMVRQIAICLLIMKTLGKQYRKDFLFAIFSNNFSTPAIALVAPMIISLTFNIIRILRKSNLSISFLI